MRTAENAPFLYRLNAAVHPALVPNELLAYGPASLGELEALKPFIQEDEDSVSVDVLIDDARTLIGEAGR
jgi:hypothetical protein